MEQWEIYVKSALKSELIAVTCSSVILKENFPKETSLSSSEVDGINQILWCEHYFWVSSFFSPFSWEEWNLQTRLQKYLLNWISPISVMDKIHFLSMCDHLGCPNGLAELQGNVFYCVYLCLLMNLSSESLWKHLKINLTNQNDKI